MRQAFKMKTSFRTVLLLFPILLVVGCSSAGQKQKAFMERGDKFYAEQKYTEAIIEYLNVLQIDDNNVEACRKVASSYYSLEGFRECAKVFCTAKEYESLRPNLRLKLARCFINLGYPSEGRKELAFILDKDSQRIEALVLLADTASTPGQISDALDRLRYVNPSVDPQEYNLAMGVLDARRGDLSTAERYLNEALKGKTQMPEAHMALGNVALAGKDFTLAEREFKAAAELTPDTSAAHVRLADFYLSRKDPKQAKKVLENIIQKYPDFSPALHRLARIALESKKFDQCDKYLRAALDKNSSDLEAKTIHAQLLLARSETARAAKEIEEVVRALPDAPMPKYLLGLARMKEGDAFGARAPLQQAVDQAPNFMPAVLLLAEANEHAGAHERAIESLFSVVAKNPGNLQAYGLLAETAKTADEIEKAEQLLEKGVLFFGNNPKFYMALGLIYLKEGEIEKAEGAVKQALAKGPDFADAHVLLGDCFLKQKDNDRAGREYKKAVELSPGASIAYTKLAEFYLMENKVDEAKQILSEAAAKSPEFLPASISLAKIAYLQKDFNGSIKLLDGILKKNPNCVGALTLRGQVKMALGKTTDALGDLRRALEIDPDSEEALNLTGLAYLKESDFDYAKSFFSELVQLDPDLYSPRLRLATLDLRSGNFQSAVDNLEVLVDKGAREPSIYLLLGLAYLGKKDPVDAGIAFQKYLEKNPRDARGEYFYGLALRKPGKRQGGGAVFRGCPQCFSADQGSPGADRIDRYRPKRF